MRIRLNPERVPAHIIAKQGKYRALRSSQNAGVYLDQYVCSPDGKRIPQALLAIGICEDEKSALALNAIYRQKRVRFISYQPEVHWDAHLATVVGNASKVFIVKDNDSLKDNKDAGGRRADKIRALLPQREVSVVMTPDHNDLADLIKDRGAAAAMEWLHLALPSVF
jgi:hypothetical protein